MGRDVQQKLAVLDIFVAEAMVFGTEDQRDFALPGGGGDSGRNFARGLAVGAVESLAAGGADHQRAIGDGGADGIVKLRLR